MSVCHLRHIATPLGRTVWALVFIVFLFSAPKPLFADTPPLLLEVSSALTSFYSSKFEGKKTANGQRYNSEALTAAHRSLPFGTVVRITNQANGRDAIVRINDRGPGSKRLLLDISTAAARELNMIRAGVAKIHMEVVSDTRGRPLIPGTEFYLDMGTASSESRGKADVESLREQLRMPAGTSIRLVREAMPGQKVRYFVGIGPYSTFTKAEKAFIDLKKAWPRTRVVCAKTRDLPPGANLALAIPADDLPDSVAGYKGKSRVTQVAKSKSTKATRSTGATKASKASKSSKASKNSVAKASKAVASKAPGTSKKLAASKTSPRKAVATRSTTNKVQKTAASKGSSKTVAAKKTSTRQVAVKKASASKKSQPTQVAAKKTSYKSVAEN